MQMRSAMVYVPEVPVLFPKNWQQKKEVLALMDANKKLF